MRLTQEESEALTTVSDQTVKPLTCTEYPEEYPAATPEEMDEEFKLAARHIQELLDKYGLHSLSVSCAHNTKRLKLELKAGPDSPTEVLSWRTDDEQ